MSKNIVQESGMRLLIKQFGLIAIVLTIVVLFTAIAQMQNAGVPANDSPLTPQTLRPDILWMRGGNTTSIDETYYSPDGQVIAISSGRQIKIIRSSDGVLLHTINHMSGDRPGFAFSPDGQTIAVVVTSVSPPNGNELQILRVSDLSLIRSIPVSDVVSITRVSFSPDATKILAGLFIYNVGNGSVFFNLVHTFPFDFGFDLFSPDGQYIYGHSVNLTTGATAIARWSATNPTVSTITDASGNAGRPVAISPNTGQFIVTLTSYVVRVSDGVTVSALGDIGDFSFSPNGQYVAGAYVAGGGVGGTVKLCRTSDWGTIWSKPADQLGVSTYGTIGFSPDSQALVVSTSNTRLWNSADGSLIRNLTTLGYAPVQSLVFSTDGQTLATASPDSGATNTFGTIQLWNVSSGARRNVNFPQSVGVGIDRLFITPDNQKLMTHDSINIKGIVTSYIKFWNANDGSLIRNVTLTQDRAGDVSLSPDGQIYVVGSSPGIVGRQLDFYNTSDDSLIRTVSGVGGGGGSAFSPNGQLFATYGNNQATIIKIINVSDGTVFPQTLNLTGSLSGIFQDMVFSPDNQTIAIIERTGSSNARTGIIELFRVSDGTLLRTFGTFELNWGATVAFAPDGQTVIGTGQDQTVRIWRVSDGTLLQTYNQETSVQPSGYPQGGNNIAYQVAYSPDGSRFAYGRQDATVVMARNPNRRAPFDFDGDGKSDVSVFRPSSGVWYLLQSTAGFTGVGFGISTDKIVPADYDGDGKTDIAVYRSGTWYLLRSTLGFTGITFGDPTDIPQPADFDGDGRAELAVFRPSNGTWYVLNLVNNQFSAVQFGASSDAPVVGDYDGDGKADYAVYRNGTWYLLRSSLGFTGIAFGVSTDKPVVGDYDGDGKADLAVFRPSNGTWYLQQSTAGFTGTPFGIATDLPAPADYDGDGKTDLAVFRDGTWYQLRSTQGFASVPFGASGDKPVPNAFVP